MPFAEYIPLRAISERVSSYAKTVTQDMVAGTGNGLLRGGPVPIGDVICFEVAYDGLVRSSVSAGAQLLVVQTNNATFGHTAETYQQLAMSQLRAVETGRTVVQAATTGKSAIIGPDGTCPRRVGRAVRAAPSSWTPSRCAPPLRWRSGSAPCLSTSWPRSRVLGARCRGRSLIGAPARRAEAPKVTVEDPRRGDGAEHERPVDRECS